MTLEQLNERLEAVSRGIEMAQRGGVEGPASMCGMLQEDLQLEDHQVVHQMCMTMASLCVQGGLIESPGDLVMIGFLTGRRFGMHEAADAMTEIERER